MYKNYTLVLCRRPAPSLTEAPQLLLGMKKRGFGEGKYNGFGGKLEPGETVREAAARELQEESALVASTQQLRMRGTLLFYMRRSRLVMNVTVFECAEFSGTATETEEMAPRWFDEDALPLDQMWQDDRIWMPSFLRGKNFVGRCPLTPYSMLSCALID